MSHKLPKFTHHYPQTCPPYYTIYSLPHRPYMNYTHTFVLSPLNRFPFGFFFKSNLVHDPGDAVHTALPIQD